MIRKQELERSRRNANPHKSAVAAKYLFFSCYNALNRYPMDLWDKLNGTDKRLCQELVADILKAPPEEE